MGVHGNGPGTSSVAAKRKASSVSMLRKKEAAGETTGNERSFVRIGRGTTAVLTGREDLSTWTNEELERGQKMSVNGDFRGRPPQIIPKAIHDELVRRTLAKAQEVMRSNTVAAVEILVDIAKGADVEPKDKLKAIQMIMDRVMGKTPEKIDVTVGEKPAWEVALEHAIVGTDDDVDDVIEANAVELEDEDDDPFGIGED